MKPVTCRGRSLWTKPLPTFPCLQGKARPCAHAASRLAVGSARGAQSRTASAMALIWAGVVPQQPPTRFKRPSRAKLPITEAMCSGVSSYSPNALGRPAFGCVLTKQLGGVGQHLHVRTQIVRAQRAVEAYGQGPRVLHGVVERFGGLPRQGAAGTVRNGAGDHHRHARAALMEQLAEREQRRLGVERIEDGLDHDRYRRRHR